MQLQNSTVARKRLLVISGVVFVVLVVVSIFYALEKNGIIGSDIDKPSGETISSPTDREAETYGVGNNTITFYGTSELTRAGVMSFMVQALRNELRKYSSNNGEYIKSASVYIKTIDRQSDDKGTTIGFQMLINNKDKVDASLFFDDLTNVVVKIIDSKGTVLIKSEKISYRAVDDNYTGDGAAPEE